MPSVSLDALFQIGGWLLLGLAAFHAVPALIVMPRRTLTRLGATVPVPLEWPPVSVIIAARDEEARIGATLNGLLASDYPSLEIILANDRSTDRTGPIAAAIAEQDARLKIVTIDAVPSGWLGKTNAMAQAVQQAGGSYLLFTDGDVQIAPPALRQTMRYVLGKRLDHFCLFPTMETQSWPERVLVSMFAMLFAFGTCPWLRRSGAARETGPGRFRRRTGYYGIGAFNLVRRAAYDAVGGHEPIRMDILDDVKLGKLLSLNGASADYLVAGPAVSVRWQNSAWGVIRGLEKNAFASMDYSVGKLLGFSVFFVSVFLAPIPAVIFLHGVSAVPFVLELAVLHVALGRLSSAFGGSWLVIPGFVPGSLGLLFAFWRSALLTLRQGGVRWRDTFYSIEELRRNLLR